MSHPILSCAQCGASIKNSFEGKPSIRCEYCGTQISSANVRLQTPPVAQPVSSDSAVSLLLGNLKRPAPKASFSGEKAAEVATRC